MDIYYRIMNPEGEVILNISKTIAIIRDEKIITFHFENETENVCSFDTIELAKEAMNKIFKILNEI